MEKFEKILIAQRDYFGSQATKPVNFRITQLKRLRDVLKSNETKMNDAIYADFKKSRFDTFTNELALLYLDIDEAIRNLPKWSKRKRVGTNLINFPAKSYIYPEPIGSSLIIGAWNYPFQLSFAPVIAAIAAGNTVVLKPSEVPSATSAIISQIVNDTFDKKYFYVVEGGVPETTELLKLKWDKIFFTGSVPVGKIVYKAAAENLTPVTLELGGKSPAIVTSKADINLAVKRIVWGKFLNAGQTCIAPDYVIVDEAVEKEFISKLVKRIEEMKFSFENENYVQIINEKNMDRLSKLLEEDKIIYGGEIDMDKRYFSPTVMRDVSFDDKVMQDEIFGPILPIISYSNLDDAIRRIKQLPKPLSCYLFTKESGTKRKVLRELSFGGGAVNDTIMHITNSKLPFGGVGSSGIGNYHGQAGFDAFTHNKSVLDKGTWFDPDFKYPPYSEKKIKWLRWLLRI
ncbi:MAG: aldehyde dehydrogenase [Fluviicola sp.]|nr:MAG: aldehyde dehydrogenase [Fluviicola sp.]